jgi:hypothetical protein
VQLAAPLADAQGAPRGGDRLGAEPRLQLERRQPPQQLGRHIPPGGDRPGALEAALVVLARLGQPALRQHEVPEELVRQRQRARLMVALRQHPRFEETALGLHVAAGHRVHPAERVLHAHQRRSVAERRRQLARPPQVRDGFVEVARLRVENPEVADGTRQAPAGSELLADLSRPRQRAQRLVPLAGVLGRETEVVVDVRHAVEILDAAESGQRIQVQLLELGRPPQSPLDGGRDLERQTVLAVRRGGLEDVHGARRVARRLFVLPLRRQHVRAPRDHDPELDVVLEALEIIGRALEGGEGFVEKTLAAMAIGDLAVETRGDARVELVFDPQPPDRALVVLERGTEGVGAEVKVAHVLERRMRRYAGTAFGFTRIVAIAILHGLPLARWFASSPAGIHDRKETDPTLVQRSEEIPHTPSLIRRRLDRSSGIQVVADASSPSGGGAIRHVVVSGGRCRRAPGRTDRWIQGAPGRTGLGDTRLEAGDLVRQEGGGGEKENSGTAEDGPQSPEHGRCSFRLDVPREGLGQGGARHRRPPHRVGAGTAPPGGKTEPRSILSKIARLPPKSR